MSPDEPSRPGEPQPPDSRDPTKPHRKPPRPELPPVLRKVNLDADGMPLLPNRVPDRDPHATRVQSRAPIKASQPGSRSRNVRRARRGTAGQQWRRVFAMIGLIVFAAAVTALTLAASYGIYEYYRIAATLPSPDELSSRAAKFESTYIYDGSGALLYEINDPNKGRRTRIPASKISPYLIAATIATEDRDYYKHPGFDIVAILKALYRAYRYGGELGGASTITQQLTRALYFRLAACDKPDADVSCYEHTLDRKVREIILAAEINRRYAKDEILELYLNEIYYGNLAYGVEAAAETYFDKDAASLTLAEASFLAGLPQSPAVYDVFQNEEAAFERQKQVLLLMIEASGDCSQPGSGIYVSNAPQPVCITPSEAAAAILDIRARKFTPPAADATYPHWVDYIRLLLESQYGQELYRAGFRVYTTLSPALQDLAEAEVRKQVNDLAAQNVTDGALVAIDPANGRILAMVGSNDYADPTDGQINMAIRPRQPGSSIKPLTYAAAFQKGWTAATLLWDVPTKFPDGANPPYEPANYDGRFHGPVRARDALANSYNIPAVKALQFVGIYDDPDTPQREGLISFAESLGITTLTRKDYGLALTLGGGDVTLLEMTGAYAAFANGGKRVFPVAITRIENSLGAAICQQPAQHGDVNLAPNGDPLPACQPVPPNWEQQVVRPEHAFLISDILADNHARALAFGPSSALKLSFPAAVKTGTTNDYRDNWTVGYTPNLVVGVWVGNADYTPMAQGVSGVTGAGPIWHNVMENAWAALNSKPAPFIAPPGIVARSICAVTGAAQNNYCQNIVDPRRPNEPPVISEFFAADQPPLPAERDLLADAFIDKFSGLRVSAFCPEDWEEKQVVNIADPFALDYLERSEQGQKWAAVLQIMFPITPAPAEACSEKSPRPIVSIISPSEFQTLDGVVPVFGLADVANGEFDHFTVDYGLSHDPGGWGVVSGPNPMPVKAVNQLTNWDTSGLPDGAATIRLVVYNKSGRSAEARVRVWIQHPTSVPTSTPPPTDTPPPTPTAPPTAAPITPSATASFAPTGTQAPAPTATPAPPTATATSAAITVVP